MASGVFDGRSFVGMLRVSAGPLVKPSYKLNRFLLETGFHLSQARQIRIFPYGSLVSVLSRYVVIRCVNYVSLGVG